MLLLTLQTVWRPDFHNIRQSCTLFVRFATIEHEHACSRCVPLKPLLQAGLVPVFTCMLV